MTLTTLLLRITLAALALTGVTWFVFKKKDNLLLSLLQNFTGALFLFSGYVKAVDPLGTAYKMEQYFAEFESTFADTALSFIAPMFPALAEYSVAFSVFMIVLEIVLGLALILGAWPKLTSWLFFLIVLFFTVLTGFTYTTGYVPSGVNYFAFGEWGEYLESNMKVTDCGCFGDFIKLEPFQSFMKDVFLMVPAIIFLWWSKKMHQLFDEKTRNISLGVLGVVTLLYCFSNYAWDIPGQDFRPFKVGTDVAAVKKAESEAAANVSVIAYVLTNKASGEVKELPTAEFLKVMSDYPQSDWEYDTKVSEPAIEPTKISDFELSDTEGYDPIPELLEDDAYTFLVVAYKLKGDQGSWDADYVEKWTANVQPVIKAAQAAGHKAAGMTKFNDDAVINDFKQQVGADYPFWRGDDIMLKTIIRSNPGVVLMKNGVIINKWHYSKLPSFEEIKAGDMVGK
ncbi:MAG: DoxX family protein [Bacteroidota bacterium]